MKKGIDLRLGAWLVAALALSCCCGARGQAKAAPDSLRDTARALEQQGRNVEAEAAWRKLVKAHPADPEPYAQLGLLAARQDRYKDAVPLYRKALALDPKVASVRLDLGLALFKDGDSRGAIHEFAVLLKAKPDDFQLNALTGMAHYGLAEYADAVPYLKAAAAQQASNLPLRLALAHSCLWSKQFNCVMDVYRQILDLNAESAEADMLAGEALDEMKDNEGSTKMFRAAVAANPKEPNVHFGLGYLLWTQKQYAEAATEFQAELGNDPDHTQALLYLADTDIQTNRIEDARPLLKRVEKMNSAIPLAHLDLGIVYTEAGEKENALGELTAAERLSPNDVNVHWRLARLYQKMGKKGEAKAEFEKAGKLNKAADDDLYRKIANGNARPAQPAGTQASPNP